MQVTSAVVLAAGEGRRLRPLTRHRPKPTLPAGGRSILERVLDGLIDAGIETLHVVVGYRSERVRSRLGSEYRGRPIHYHEQSPRLGTGHALAQVEGAVEPPFVVTNGDERVRARTVQAVIERHEDHTGGDRRADTPAATLGAIERADPPHGAVRMADGEVRELVEEPTDGDYGLMNSGVYVFDGSIFDAIDRTPTDDGETTIPAAVTTLSADAPVAGVRTAGRRIEVVYPWDLLELARAVLADEAAAYPTTDGVARAASATVHEDATLLSPVAVGPDAVIEPGAVVGPSVTVGRNATVAAGATVRRSVIDADTRVGRTATLAGVVTGTGVRIGPGVTVPDGPHDVRVGDAIHEDRALGAVVADRARIGAGATVAGGALVGPEATVAPGTGVRRNVPAATEVRD